MDGFGQDKWEGGYNVQHIATKPAAQGKGLGTAMMHHPRDKAMVEKKCVALTSQKLYSVSNQRLIQYPSRRLLMSLFLATLVQLSRI